LAASFAAAFFFLTYFSAGSSSFFFFLASFSLATFSFSFFLAYLLALMAAVLASVSPFLCLASSRSVIFIVLASFSVGVSEGEREESQG